MIHEMRLNRDPFEKIRSGRKTVELRLNDEKRRRLNVGDEIEFLERDMDQRFRVRITALHRAPSFVALLSGPVTATAAGYDPAWTPQQVSDAMHRYYAAEEEAKDGVVGIEVKVL